jgi:TrmH family RNA methyltransferase
VISRHHALARRLRALRRDPALRAQEGVLVAEGIHLAGEALRSQAKIEEGVIAPRLLATPEGREIAGLLRDAGVPIHEATDAAIDTLQDARSPQPVVLLVRREAHTLAEVFDPGRGVPMVVVACGIQDPGNLGALMRTAEAAGGTGFIATSGSADLGHPRTVRATMGSIFRLPSVEAADGEAVEAAASRGIVRVGTAARDGAPYDRFDWNRPIAVFLGSEGAGLPGSIIAKLDAIVTIPMRAEVESLSVGAAGAVLLFEAARARRLTRGG